MGFEQVVRRLALSGGRGWLGSLGVALACVLACTVIRIMLTPVLGSLGGTTIFLPAVYIAGLWSGRRGAYSALLLGIAAAWVVAWLHPDPINLRQFLIGVGLVGFVGIFSSELAAALRRTLQAEAAVVDKLEGGQQRLRLAHEAGALGTWEWDIATDLLHLSDGYLRNWRVLNQPDLPFMEVAKRVHPDDQAAVMESRRRVLEDGEAYQSEYRVIGEDGQVRWYTSRGEPVRDARGKVVRVHGVNRDITEQMQAENTLRESEVRFRTMANSAPSPVWVTRPEGGIEFVNEAFAEFFGVDPENLLGDVWTSLMHPDDQQHVVEVTLRERGKGHAYEFEGRFRNAAGEYRSVHARCRPRQGPGGEFMGYVGIAFDVTEARNAVAALRESEARFRLIADSAPVNLWMGDETGACLYLNKAQREFWGAGEDYLSSFDWNATLHPDDRSRMAAVVGPAMRDHTPFEIQARYRRADGEWRLLHTQAQPRFGPQGEFLGMIGVNVDVTENQLAQDLLRAQERRQRFLLQLGDGLRESEEPRAIAAFAERALGEHLHVARAGYGEIDEETGAISIEESWTDGSLEPISGIYTPEAYGGALIAELSRGRTVRVEDTATDPRTANIGDAFPARGVGSRLSVPVVRGGRTRAVFFLHDSRPRAWADDDVALVEEAASRTWTEIERARALAEVRESEERFRSISDSAPILVWVTNADRKRAFVNKTYVEFLGGTYEDALNLDWRKILHPDDWDRILKEQIAGEGSLQPFSLEARYHRHDGTYRWLRSFSRPRFGRDRELVGFVGAAYDVTEERQVQADLEHINELLAERVAQALAEKEKAEAALIRAQKLEALGRLTGGVAHDFNNLLTVVVGALDMILKHPDDPAKRTRMAEAAMAAARRGEQLTHQLLAFSRRQPLRPALSDINALIRENEPLIRRATGEAVEFVADLSKGEAVARVDPAQFEAALFNLVVNARDATSDGGRITVTTQRRAVAEGEAAEIPAGEHIVVSVSDTGAGMEPAVLARVFEPFFTTKAQGKGTGLGLSQVYGFAQQSGGGVAVDSTPGKGSVVTLYLPASAEALPAAAPDPAAHTPLGSLKVLLVEDDAAVAGVAETMLRHLGHEVTRVSSSPRALAKLRSKTPFDLLLSDVIMPGAINGVDLARRAAEMRPDLKIVLSSGYAGEALDDTLSGQPWPFLRKPYSQQELAEILRLAAAPAAPAPSRVRGKRAGATRSPAKRKASGKA